MLCTTGTAYTYSYIRTRMIPGTNRVRVTSTYHTYYQGTWYIIRTTLGGTIFSPYVYVGVFLLSSIGHTRRATRGCWASLVYRGGFITFITYLVQNCCTGITGPYPSNQNPRWTQNNIYIYPCFYTPFQVLGVTYSRNCSGIQPYTRSAGTSRRVEYFSSI